MQVRGAKLLKNWSSPSGSKGHYLGELEGQSPSQKILPLAKGKGIKGEGCLKT